MTVHSTWKARDAAIGYVIAAALHALSASRVSRFEEYGEIRYVQNRQPKMDYNDLNIRQTLQTGRSLFFCLFKLFYSMGTLSFPP